MCDGSIRLLKKDDSSPQRNLTSLVTRSGGEIITSDLLADTIRPQDSPLQHASRPNMPTADTPATLSVEQRLQKVEEKLDRLLEKLDAR